MQHEAAYKCKKCDSIYHVRCMGRADGVGHAENMYTTECFLCNFRGPATSAATGTPSTASQPAESKGIPGVVRGKPKHSSSGEGEGLIIDVMGVCS